MFTLVYSSIRRLMVVVDIYRIYADRNAFNPFGTNHSHRIGCEDIFITTAVFPSKTCTIHSMWREIEVHILQNRPAHRETALIRTRDPSPNVFDLTAHLRMNIYTHVCFSMWVYGATNAAFYTFAEFDKVGGKRTISLKVQYMYFIGLCAI